MIGYDVYAVEPGLAVNPDGMTRLGRIEEASVTSWPDSETYAITTYRPRFRFQSISLEDGDAALAEKLARDVPGSAGW